MTRKRAIGYVRTCADCKQDVSLEYQTAQIERLCKREGLGLVRVEQDTGRSRDSLFARPGARAVITAVEGQAVAAVVVYQKDRLCVNAQEELDATNLFVRLGVQYWSCREGRLAREVLDEAFLKHIHSERESQSVGGAVNQRPKKSAIASGYGWRREGGKMVLVPEEQRLIRRIWHLHRLGHRPGKIAQRVNQEGFRKRNGGLFDGRLISKIKKSNPPRAARDLRPGENLSGLPPKEKSE